NPNFSERNPSQAEQIPNSTERNANSRSFNFLLRIEPFQEVAPTRHPPTRRRFARRPAKAQGSGGARAFASGSRSFCLRFLVLRSREEGLAPFRSPSRGRHWPRPAAAKPR